MHAGTVAPPVATDVPGLDDGSAAAVLDAAEDIINNIGAQVVLDIENEKSQKRRWWRRKK